MSPQDTQMLHDFLGQLIQARGIQKDPDADALIQRAVVQQPDAAYLLVQRALLLEQALNSAKGQIATLEGQLNSARAGQQGGNGRDGRFLDPNAWGNSARSGSASVQSYQREAQPPYQTQYQPQYQPQYQAPPLSSGFLRGGLGGTLGSIAATAAGVAAGGFLFQGLENMFGHHEHGGNHLLNSDDTSNNLFSDPSGSALADQAGLGDIGQSFDNGTLGDSGDGGDSAGQGLFDGGSDSDVSDNSGGFFDGDGSDEGLFS